MEFDDDDDDDDNVGFQWQKVKICFSNHVLTTIDPNQFSIKVECQGVRRGFGYNRVVFN